jgi:tRNA 2-thiouridine synthesizing protein C
LTYIFSSTPHSTSSGREGLDALLAASAYCEDIRVIFMGDGVYQLLKNQETQRILSKDYAPLFKLMELYDVDSIYICERSMKERGLVSSDFLIHGQFLDSMALSNQLHIADKVLTF